MNFEDALKNCKCFKIFLTNLWLILVVKKLKIVFTCSHSFTRRIDEKMSNFSKYVAHGHQCQVNRVGEGEVRTRHVDA